MNNRERQRQYQEKYQRKFQYYWFRYCREPLENIEGWNEMLNDTSGVRWHLHHRAEIVGDTVVSKDELKHRGEYYSIPACKLIFLSESEHHSLHHHSEETKKKISEAKKGKQLSEEHKNKISENNWMRGRTGADHPNYGTNKYCITKEYLYELYVVQGLTQQEIGDIIGCSQGLISLYLRKYNINR